MSKQFLRLSEVYNGSVNTTQYIQVLDDESSTKLDNIGVQVNIGAGITGSVSLYASIDGVNYVAIGFTEGVATLSGSADTFIFDLNQRPFIFLQCKITVDSGSGTVQILISGAGL